MNCPSCGSDLPATAKFCGSCGFHLTAAAAPVAAMATASGASSLTPQGQMRSYDEIATTPFTVGVGDILSESWELTKPHLGLLLGISVVASLLFFASSFFVFGPILIGGPLFGGVTAVSLRVAAGRPIEFGNMFDGFRRFLPLALAFFVAGMAIAIGFFLLVFPGLYLGLAFMFAGHLIVDRDEEFWPALMGSMRVVNAHLGTILVYVLVMGGLSIVASIPFGLGYFVFAPFALIASAVLYKHLFGVAGGAERLAG